ncbi:hypothetical protein Taro_033533 [Colocasia esculenta]|uniref:Uncharacterized protein n=1 Tax=Colocasia esculenta TaxID=4460 RepID=A0A843W9A3_COLES|nr:hypothetical protein [Colocasia esculenta]
MARVCGCAAICSVLVVGGFSTGAPKGVRLGPAGCGTYKLWWLVNLHYSWLVVVERQLDLPFMTTRLRGSSYALLSGLYTGIMNQ